MCVTTVLAAVAFYAVEPMSNTQYLPDRAPEDGVKGGAVKILAARGEYESGSFVLTSDVDVKDATLAWGDLVAEDGAKIPASALDAKVVLCWYQQGNAWYSYFSDMTRPVLTPELLVHDEKLVRVDHVTKDNYVRGDFKDGTSEWIWNTYLAIDINGDGNWCDFNCKWVHDAPTLQPFDLTAGKYKQFWLTLGVPKDAKAGLYRGEVRVEAGRETGDGRREMVAAVPVLLRILPFELPKPGVFRDPTRPFHVSFYMGEAMDGFNDAIAQNCIRHNLTQPFLKQAKSRDEAKRLYDVLDRNGFDTSMLFSHLPGSGFTLSWPPKETDASWVQYGNFCHSLSNAMRLVRERYGEKAVPFSYGIDEAGAASVRAERGSWSQVQALGGRTIVATQPQDFILFALDAAAIPMRPGEKLRKWCDLLHESNPEMLIGWYAVPHAAPESPELARRQYGWLSWRNNLDMVSQYVTFVRGWPEFNRPYENFLRSLTMFYVGEGQVIDTLQWEGFREAIDDIRYGTLLKTLALEAVKSKDVKTMYLGRAALTWLAQVPYDRSSLNSLRREMIDKILKLMEVK